MMGDFAMMGDGTTAWKKRCLMLGLGGELSDTWEIRATCAVVSCPV